MRIVLMVEGNTEKAFLHVLRAFLEPRLRGRMPAIRPNVYHGRIPKQDDLRRRGENFLSGPNPYDAVVALTDVYTGTADFVDAADAKAKMRNWVGTEERFYPHAAQYDFEAWLLPFWADIQRLAGHRRSAPVGPPEQVNHNKPPSRHIAEIFRAGTCRDDYSKTRDMPRILQGKDLMVAATVCPELRALLNTILKLCDGELIAEPRQPQ